MKKYDTTLTNERFFTKCLDLTYPGLEEIADFAQKGDYETCEKLFAKVLKATLKKEKFLDRSKNLRSNTFHKRDETNFDIAERIINLNEFESCSIRHRFENGVEFGHNPTPDNYREWTWQFNRHPEWGILAECYDLTGDEKYALKFRELILEFIRQMPFPGEVTGGETEGWRTIELGIRCSNAWPIAFHIFLESPSISDHDWTVIFKSVYENSDRLYRHSTCGNWLIMEMNGLAHNAVLYSFFKQSAEWLCFAQKQLSNQLNQQIYDDGFQYELSTEYHHVVIYNYFWVVKLLKKYDVPILESFLSGLEKMYDLYIKIVSPLLKTPALNDGDEKPVAPIFAEALELFASNEQYRYFATDRAEGKKPDFDSVFLPYSGMVVMREGWEEDDMWCFFESAPFGFGHQHEDKLNLVMNAYAKEMLTEAGRNAYDASVRHIYSLSTQGHNCIMVDGCGQNRRQNFNRNDININEKANMTFTDTKQYVASEGVYDERFGAEYFDVSHKRRVIFIKKHQTLPKMVVVIDRMLSKDQNQHNYEALWHYADSQYEMCDEKIINRFGDGVELDTFLDGFDTVKVVRGQEEPYQGWLASPDVNEIRSIPTAVLSKKATGDVRLVSVFVPVKDDERTVVGIEASNDVNDTKITIKTDSQIAVLCEKDYFA